jgi:hypothetical protein
MAQIIALPDGTELEMSDTPSPQEITKLKEIQTYWKSRVQGPPVDPQQAARTAGATQAAAPPPRMPGPFEPGAMAQVPEGVKEVGRVLDKTVRGGIVALPNAATEGLSWVGEKALGLKQDSPEVLAQRAEATKAMRQDPISRFLDKTLFSEINEPKTTAGKIAGTIGEGAVSALAVPGGFARPVLGATVGGASAGAGDLIYRATENPLLAAGGAVGTGILGGLAGLVKGTKASLAQTVAGDIPEHELRAGKARMIEMRNNGVEGNLAQAMPQRNELETITGRLADMSAGKKVQDQLMRQPGQAEALVQRGIAAIPGTVRAPRQAEDAIQEAATYALTAARGDANREFREILAKSGGPSQLRPDTVAELDKTLAQMAKNNPNSDLAMLADTVRDKLFTTNVVENRVRQRAADGNRWEYVTEKVKQKEAIVDPEKLKQAVEDALDGFSKRELNDTSKSARYLRYEAKVMEAFKSALAKDSPEMGAAAQAYSKVMDTVYNPMKKSVVGRVAGIRGASDTTEAVGGRAMAILDKGVDPNAITSEVRELAKAVRSTPGVFTDLNKTWLSGKAAEASNAARSGQQPASFIDAMVSVAGDPRVPSAKSTGFQHNLEGIAADSKVDPKALITGWDRARTVLSDLTKRPNTISSIDEREAAIAAQGAASRVLSRFGVFVGIRNQGERLGEVLSRNAYEAMSEMLTTPEGVDMLIKLSRTPARSHAAVTALSTFLGTNAALNDAAGKGQ